jgi:hypothetical protein
VGTFLAMTHLNAEGDEQLNVAVAFLVISRGALYRAFEVVTFTAIRITIKKKEINI